MSFATQALPPVERKPQRRLRRSGRAFLSGSMALGDDGLAELLDLRQIEGAAAHLAVNRSV